MCVCVCVCVCVFPDFDITSLLSGDHHFPKEDRSVIDNTFVDIIHFFQKLSIFLSIYLVLKSKSRELLHFSFSQKIQATKYFPYFSFCHSVKIHHYCFLTLKKH